MDLKSALTNLKFLSSTFKYYENISWLYHGKDSLMVGVWLIYHNLMFFRYYMLVKLTSGSILQLYTGVCVAWITQFGDK